MRSSFQDMIRSVSVPRSGILVLLTLALGGCEYVRGVARDMRLPLLSRSTEQLTISEPRPYPAGAEIGAPLDIEVIREGGAIVLDNRTVGDYQGVSLWLNQDYGGVINALPIGRGRPLALTSLVNRYGEHYPIARFLQPELDRTLVLAELMIDGKLHKLTVRLEDNWREPL